MRILAAVLAIGLAHSAPAEEAAITLVKVGKAHGKLFRTETITAKSAGKDATLVIEVAETLGEKPRTTECPMPRATFEALVRLVRHRGLDSWNALPGIAYDWGDESYELGGDVKKSEHWTGPLDSAAPPHALFRAMGDLAKSLSPKIELKWFPGVGAVTGRIRLFATFGGPRKPNLGGAQDVEVEVEAREGSWAITVRRGRTEEAPEVAEARKALTKEEWEALVKEIADSKFAEWDETKVRGMPDFGTCGIETELDGKGVQKLWHGSPTADVPGQRAADAIQRLAEKKGLEVGFK